MGSFSTVLEFRLIELPIKIGKIEKILSKLGSRPAGGGSKNMAVITNLTAELAGAATENIVPPAGEAYCIVEVGSDEAFVGAVPDVEVSIGDGVLANCIVIIDPTTAVQKGARAKEIYITPTDYLVIDNTAAANAYIAFFGYQVNANNVRTDMYTAPAAGTVDVRPPAGEVWRVTEVGGETMGAANHPNVTIFLTDDVLVASALCDQTHGMKWAKNLNWIIDHDTFLRVDSIAAADCDMAFSAIRIPQAAFCGVTDVVGSATLDIQPAAGVEVMITEISAETWVGIAPAGSPDLTAGLYDGVGLAFVMEAADSLLTGRKMDLPITNANYLRITETSTANNEIGYTGYVIREFNP